MIKRVRINPKLRSKSKGVSPVMAPRLRLFGAPQVLEGEDGAAYDELLARICAAVKPVDIIEEMFIFEVVALEWEVLRWRRLKSSLIRARGLKALEDFLSEQLHYGLYREHFADDLARILQENVQVQAEEAPSLARECARNEPDAVDKVNAVLAGTGLDMDGILDSARTCKAKELVQQYVGSEPGTVTLVHELLTAAGVSIDAFMADALADKLNYIERIDHLTTIVENRRNDSLHEIDRRRAILGESLRRSVQEIEDGEFRVIEEKQPKGKSSA